MGPRRSHADGPGPPADARASHLADVRRRFLTRFSDDELAEMAAFWERLDEDGGHD